MKMSLMEVSHGLALFGAVRLLEPQGKTLAELPWQRPVALLAFLGCRPGWHSRESLAQWLRPDLASSGALAYLRRTLHRLQEIAPGLSELEIENTRVRWNGGSDVASFDAAFERRDWSSAIGLQLHPLLERATLDERIPADDWFLEERARLSGRLATALMAAITHTQDTLHAECSHLMEALARSAPLSETAIQFLLSRARTPAERVVASEAYRTLEARLAQEAQRQPAVVTSELHAALRATTPAEAATGLDRQEPPSDSMPIPLPQGTPLGRAAEIEALQRLLDASGTALITISGPGGVGKTSLARALYALERERGAQPCYWLDLQACDTREELIASLSEQWGLPPGAGVAEERLIEWLAHHGGVAFLDNFEQLIAHTPVLRRLLAASRGMRFVVTSREALGVPEETLFPLQGLPCDGAASPALELLYQQAERLGCPIAEADHAPAAELVAYLEGLPLAIELAALWLPLLRPGAVLAELRKSPAFVDAALSPAARSAKTMQSVFDATWARLDTDERAVLASLSVVRTPMRMATARAVAGIQDVSVFHRLVGKSLLERAGRGRFKIHPLVREFAMAQAEPGIIEAARLRHSEHFMRWVAAPPAVQIGQHHPERLQDMLSHAEDISAAWRTAADRGRIDLIELAMPNMAFFVVGSSQYETGLALSLHVFERLDRKLPALGLQRALHCAALFRVGRIEEAFAACQEVLAESKQRIPRAWIHIVLCWYAKYKGDLPAAEREARQALEVLAAADVFVDLLGRQELAGALMLMGRFTEARDILMSALSLPRQHAAPLFESRLLTDLGFLMEACGEHEQAERVLVESRHIALTIADDYQIALTERRLSYVRSSQGRHEAQLALAQGAMERFQNAGYYFEVEESGFAVALALHELGRLADAQSVLRHTMDQAWRSGNVPVALRCAMVLAVQRAATERPLALAALVYTRTHPVLRHLELPWMQRLWDSLQTTADERAHAQRRARRITPERLREILGTGGPLPQGGAQAARQ